ncbi:hypothetical protein OIY81_2319 [Cryptosporidium canis]|uniref:Uncharacterized protein n=1 Tax=Cryptosporidium canis TaxID=195482 RepID=A0ABQ8PC38_9CRYT|nr:hypothetical protein OIY81_2319 [Cryptosporidium canis]KAJ1615410.1 hypothetical protein OJ252_144 [Cryptosporidium canis]
MRVSRYNRILSQWLGRTRGLVVADSRDENLARLNSESRARESERESETEWGSKWRAMGEDEDERRGAGRSPIGVISAVPSVVDVVKPLADLPSSVYLDVVSRYKCLLHELKVRLIEIFRSNSNKFKIQYKLDIVDERLALVEELGQQVYKLSAADLARIHSQKDKEECLMVDKMTPVTEKAKGLIILEEEKFLLELNSKLRENLNKLNQEFTQLQEAVSQVDNQLKEANQTSNQFIVDAIDTFKKWSENARQVIQAVEKAN